MAHQRLAAVVFVIVLFGLAARATAQGLDIDIEIDSMKGLPGVAVIVERLSEDAERNGLTTTAIQTDVELKLRLAGIRALTVVEMLQAPGRPFLYVRVNTLASTVRGLHAYDIDLKLNQTVQSLVSPGVLINGATWDRSRVGTVGASNVRSVRDNVKDLVDKFINAWLTANPTQPSSPRLCFPSHNSLC